MPMNVPPILAPYLQSCLQNGTTTLITSVLETPANWLTIRFIHAALSGIDEEVAAGSTSLNDDTVNNQRPSVVFLSCLRPLEFWLEVGKKIGVNITTLLAKRQVAFIDALTIGLDTSPGTIKPKSHSLADLNHAIATAKSTLSPTSTAINPTLIIDGLDYILASQIDISASHLTTFVTAAHEQFSSIVVTASADSPLLHNVEPSATPLELEHSVFVRSMAYQSGWVLQLRPLETGHAKDVSGVVQISQGGAEGDTDDLHDGEWLYQVKGDGSVRAWNRGE